MQSGKIAPTLRNFFSGMVRPKEQADRRDQGRQQGGRDPEREPSREEALEALDLLSQQAEFQKSELRAELRVSEGRNMIFVTNALGQQVKLLRGGELLRVLDAARAGSRGARIGRILDRRI